MELRTPESIQLTPNPDETEARRYVYQVGDVAALFARLLPTFSVLDEDEIDEISIALNQEGFEESGVGIDIAWPLEGDEFPQPVPCSIYITPFGVCLDVMSDDPESKARMYFESFLEESDVLEGVVFVPADLMEERMS